MENARKALNIFYDPLSRTELSDAETTSVLDEIRMAERRAAKILSRRWEVVRVIATQVRLWGWMVACDILKAIGAERMKRASDE